jgi:hypothetical protein
MLSMPYFSVLLSVVMLSVVILNVLVSIMLMTHLIPEGELNQI